ncbi:hypothetical protein CM19_04780 [Candidatus Acidianus copahuensis]|uniref:Uncharacterized protein n=2 Tax=Sulfolobaceae TaxID=118883 RepID=A0A031LNK3_9CREN|nr:hypothetical protein CM19_04780 [Candidatus Acidianus copahuensis]NON62775.1 hypothetical protein [Acidianus sp. RZ1]
MNSLFSSILAGFLAGLFDIFFYIGNVKIFSYISYHILGINSIILGIILHLIASIVIFAIIITILNIVKIEVGSAISALILGIMIGSSVLALFSLPIHLLVFPISLDITYVLSHVFYGILGYLIYYSLIKNSKN